MNICLFLVFLVLMELVGKLRFFNGYGELETVKPGDQAGASVEAAVGTLGAGVVLIFPSWPSFLCSLEKMA